MKKKNKRGKELPKLECCGLSDNKKEKIKVYVCPRCQSVDVKYIFTLKNLFGIIPRMRCEKCNFESSFFPKWIIEKDKITKKFNKNWKKNEKEEKLKTTDFKTKIIEKYCPNCKDKVLVKMKDGTNDIFICENCKFEIKEKRKR
ncbi:MAG: hypothetical protein QW273_01350 [Candidatus Pacearchaeota archaeon]